MTQPIQIVDVGLGNIASIQRMIEKVGGRSVLIKEPGRLESGCKVILPGVGHYDEGMRRLNESGMAAALYDLGKRDKIVIMGICLGMQLLCRGSEEGISPGLGLVDADVKKFCFPREMALKVPHMGWNIVSTDLENPLLPSLDGEHRFYFVHSYKVVPDDAKIVIGVAKYGEEFCAAFWQDRVFGVQFHPEKSHIFGMKLMRRLIEL